MSGGFSLVEVILSASIFALIVTALVGAIGYGSESVVISGERARAVYLAEEGLEAARNIRDESFSNLVDGTYGLRITGGSWIFSGSSDVTDIFTREVVILTPGVDRRRVLSRVNWSQTLQRPGEVSLVTYLTNWMAVAVGDWSNPFLESSLDFSDITDGWKVQTQGNYAFAIRQTGSPDFIVVDITNPASPSISGSLDLPDGQEDIAVSGSYAYVASRSNGGELQVVDISNPALPSVVGTYNAGGTANAQGVYSVGSTVYLVRAASGANEFFVIDVSTPSAPSLIGSTNLGAGNNNELVILGTQAYVTTDSDIQELRVVDISNPASPAQIGSLDLPLGADTDTITGFGSMVVVGRINGDIYTIDVSAPSSPSILGLYNHITNIGDLSLSSDNNFVYVASDENSAEFAVVDISSLTSPALFSFLDLPANLNGVSYHSGKDRVFAVGDDNGAEFIVIAPQ